MKPIRQAAQQRSRADLPERQGTPRGLPGRAAASLLREGGPLGPAARRRLLRMAGRTAPGAVAGAMAALIPAGFFSGPALGWRQALAAAALAAALAASLVRRARDSAEGRTATARQQLELGALFVVAAYAVAQTAGAATGSLQGPLDPLVYLVMAFLVSFLPRAVGLALVALAVGLDLAGWWARGASPEELPSAAAHAGFVVLFAVLYHAVLAARVAASRRAERAAVERRLRDIDEQARQFRLLSPGASGGDDAEERERQLTAAAVVEVEAAVRGTLEVTEAALRSHTCAVYVLTPDDAELTLRECRSQNDRVARRLPAREGALGGAVARAVPVRLQGGVRGASYYEDGSRPRCLLAVPLLDRRGGFVRGVLLADRMLDAPFTDEDESLLVKLAGELLRAVAAERIMGDLKRSQDEKERFYTAIERLNRTAKPREVFDALLRVAGEIVPLDLGLVTVREERESKAVHRVARVLEGAERRVAALEGLTFADNAGLVASAVKLASTLPGKEIRVSDSVVLDESTRLRGLASLRVFPLKAGEQVLGTLVLGSRRAASFDRESVRQLEVISAQAAAAVLRARLFEQTELLATTDGLTGLANHRAFQARLDEHLAQAARYGKKLSLLLCDIDHFKVVNDTYGHPVGDQVLREVARVLSREARATDLVARYGGEEFAIVMPETDGAGALVIAERIRERVAELALSTERGPLRVTMSLGIATCPDDARRKPDLVETADACLYRAKRGGRNRTASARGPARRRVAV